MLLLIGVSVGFALSVLTSNNFYSEKTFTSSVNQWVCNNMGSDGCKNLITQVSDQQLAWDGTQSYYGGGSGGSSNQNLWDSSVENFFVGLWNVISSFFGRLF
jgi:hypothetical protein